MVPSQARDLETNFQFAAKEIKERVRVDGIRAWLDVEDEFVPGIIGILMQQTVCYILQVTGCWSELFVQWVVSCSAM